MAEPFNHREKNTYHGAECFADAPLTHESQITNQQLSPRKKTIKKTCYLSNLLFLIRDALADLNETLCTQTVYLSLSLVFCSKTSATFGDAKQKQKHASPGGGSEAGLAFGAPRSVWSAEETRKLTDTEWVQNER